MGGFRMKIQRDLIEDFNNLSDEEKDRYIVSIDLYNENLTITKARNIMEKIKNSKSKLQEVKQNGNTRTNKQ
jgi:hypothetical protein